MTLYRATVYNAHEHFDDPSLFINYQEHEVTRETPSFYIIKVNSKERKVGKKSKAPFAASTKEKALMDAWHRNTTYKGILRAKLHYADKVGKFLKDQIDSEQ